MAVHTIPMHRQIRMCQSQVQHRLFPVDHDVSNPSIDRVLPVENLEMAEKASGEIPVSRPKFQDRQARFVIRCPFGGRRLPIDGLIALRNTFVIIGRQRMGETEVGRRKGLVVGSKFVSPQPIEEPVQMGLPLIKRLVLTDQLWKGVGILQHTLTIIGKGLTNGPYGGRNPNRSPENAAMGNLLEARDGLMVY